MASAAAKPTSNQDGYRPADADLTLPLLWRQKDQEESREALENSRCRQIAPSDTCCTADWKIHTCCAAGFALDVFFRPRPLVELAKPPPRWSSYRSVHLVLHSPSRASPSSTAVQVAVEKRRRLGITAQAE